MLLLRTARRERRFRRLSAVAGCALLIASCAADPEGDPNAIHKIAFADGMSIALTADPGEPSSGEARGVPEIVYTGRQSRVAVTLSDSEAGLPLGDMHVAAKVVATRWVGPLRPLRPVALENGLYEGGIELPRHGPYRVDVEIEWPTGRATVQFGFDY